MQVAHLLQGKARDVLRGLIVAVVAGAFLAFSLVNLRVDWRDVGGMPIDVSVYGTNIFDTEYRVAANPGYNNSGFIKSSYGEPAQYGVQFRYRF